MKTKVRVLVGVAVSCLVPLFVMGLTVGHHPVISPVLGIIACVSLIGALFHHK